MSCPNNEEVGGESFSPREKVARRSGLVGASTPPLLGPLKKKWARFFPIGEWSN